MLQNSVMSEEEFANLANENLSPELCMLKPQPRDESKCSLFSNKVSAVFSNMNLEHCEPDIVLDLLRNPSLKIFNSLHKKLKNANKSWIEDFMDIGGFQLLLDSIEDLSKGHAAKLTETVTVLANVACIKATMDSQSGIEYFTNNPDSGHKLIKALDTKNVTVKMQVLELFSAITAYSTPGYEMTLNSLKSYKVMKKKRYRFSVLINEIQQNRNLPSYCAIIMAFLNCLVHANDDLYLRVQVRNEFIGLRILELLDDLLEYKEEDLLIQCDVFFEEMHNDDEQMKNLRPECIDVNSHKQVFDTIFQNVHDKVQSSSFLNVLQCLMHLESSGNSETTWLIVEDLVRKAVFGEQRKLNSSKSEVDISIANYPYPPTFNPLVMSQSKSTLSHMTSGYESLSLSSFSSTNSSLDISSITISPPNKKAKRLEKTSNVRSADEPDASQIPSMLIMTPKPKSIMKTFNWSKVSTASAIKKKVVWSDVIDMPDPVPVKYNEIESLFSNNQQQPHTDTRGHQCINCFDYISMVSLIGKKKTLDVNIFLRQFKLGPQEIVQAINNCDEQQFRAEQLKNLIRLLPQGEELEILTIFEGEPKQLSSAERFFKELLSVPYHSIKLELMLLKCEFEVIYNSVLVLLTQVITACHALMSNKSLKEFLRFVLHIGNFMNAGGYIGRAAGFKNSSLLKLIEVHSTKPRITLLHYLVAEIEKENPHVIQFVQELLPLLQQTFWLSLPGLHSEVEQLQNRVQLADQHMQYSCSELLSKYEPFMQMAKNNVQTLIDTLQETSDVKDQLANHFCEDTSTFKLEKCLETYKILCDDIIKCKEDNMKRSSNEKEKSKKKKKDQENESNKADQEETGFIERILKSIRNGTTLKRGKSSCI